MAAKPKVAKDRANLARQLEKKSPELLAAMTQALRARGIEGVRVVSFELEGDADGDTATILAAAEPCPTKCVVTPQGGIRCFPDCS